MKITNISKQKKNNDRFNIFIDDEYVFSISTNQLLEYSQYLKIGNELTDMDLAYLKEKTQEELAFNYAIYQLSFGLKSEKQLRDKLRLKEKYNDEAINYAIDKCIRLNLINDKEYASILIELYLNKKYGKRKIEQKLFQKGIIKEIYEDILNDKINEEDTLETVLDLCNRKNKTIHIDDIYKRKNKLYSYLISRGFNSDIIKIAIEKTLEI